MGEEDKFEARVLDLKDSVDAGNFCLGYDGNRSAAYDIGSRLWDKGMEHGRESAGRVNATLWSPEEAMKYTPPDDFHIRGLCNERTVDNFVIMEVLPAYFSDVYREAFLRGYKGGYKGAYKGALPG
jgi:hypothetical protein